MGSDEDPEDGGAVAAAVFGAVGIYGVSLIRWTITGKNNTDSFPDLPLILRQSSFLTPKRAQARRHRTFIALTSCIRRPTIPALNPLPRHESLIRVSA